jgi:AcrR family transcriptional regulator
MNFTVQEHTDREQGPRKGGDVEAAILDAARTLLAEKGIAGLSMRTVAERVGVSATAIYHYFENKDALVGRLVQSGFRRFGTYLEEAAAREPSGSYERVRALGEAYLRFALENQEYFRILFDIARDAPPSLDDLPEGGGYGLLRAAVVEGMEAGTIRRADPDLLVMYLWSMVHGLVTLTMACRVDRCPEPGRSATSARPLDLFHAFGAFVHDGIAVPGANATRGD